MGNNYDIILIGLVAVFLILRLRSVLGKRTGNERPPAGDPFSLACTADTVAAGRRCAAEGRPERQRQCRGAADRQRPRHLRRSPGQAAFAPTVMPTATTGVAAIRAADPTFEPLGFCAGARAAFHDHRRAFAKGDIGRCGRCSMDRPTPASRLPSAVVPKRQEKAETT